MGELSTKHKPNRHPVFSSPQTMAVQQRQRRTTKGTKTITALRLCKAGFFLV